MLYDRSALVEVDDDVWATFDRDQRRRHRAETERHEHQQRVLAHAADGEQRRRRAAPNLARLERRIAQLEAARVADAAAFETVLGDALGVVWRTLAERIAALEARPTIRYLGDWTEGVRYQPGECASFGGSVWHCNVATSERPTTQCPGWSLAVKHGRPGKPGDARAAP